MATSWTIILQGTATVLHELLRQPTHLLNNVALLYFFSNPQSETRHCLSSRVAGLQYYACDGKQINILLFVTQTAMIDVV